MRKSDRKQSRERALYDRAVQSSQLMVSVPPRNVPPELALGVFANVLDSLETETEAILDFSFVYPSTYGGAQRIPISEKNLRNDVVARVIMPPERLEQFVISYVMTRPDLIEFLQEAWARSSSLPSEQASEDQS